MPNYSIRPNCKLSPGMMLILAMEYCEERMQSFMQRSYLENHGFISTAATGDPAITMDITVRPCEAPSKPQGSTS